MTETIDIEQTPRKARIPIKVYPKIDVDLTYQNFGSAWLCILRGTTENIESVFNGLYNFCGTNGKEPDYRNSSHTCAVFWSDKKSLRRFFFNQYYIPRFDLNKAWDGKTIREAMTRAKAQIQSLRETAHEFFINFDKVFDVDTHCVGNIKAERPDSDFKDSIMIHAFQDRMLDNRKMLGAEFGEQGADASNNVDNHMLKSI